jgi:DNA-binding Lrp family transcriptional regulator
MSQKHALDRIDRQLLAALQKEGRLSNKQLAHEVGLAPSSCLERVRRLEREGVLRGYHAEANLEAIGLALQAVVMVRLARHSRELVESFRAHLQQLPEVQSVFHVAGSHDFLVHVAVEDVVRLRGLVLESFTGHPAVAHIETSLVFEHARSYRLPGAYQ